jgi:hypothetical protein
MYISRYVLFNENVFPGLKHPIGSNSESLSTVQSVDIWLITLQTLHTCSHNPQNNVNYVHESCLTPTGSLNQNTLSIPAVPVVEPMLLPNSLTHQPTFTTNPAAPLSPVLYTSETSHSHP